VLWPRLPRAVRPRTDARRDRAKTLGAKYKGLATQFDQAATVVSKAQATTPAQKQGQSDWVTGVRGAAQGFDEYADALGDVAAKNKSAAKSKLVSAVKTIDRDAKLLLKVDKLLRLSTHGTAD
jgi:lambda family phage tail tape measure protein